MNDSLSVRSEHVDSLSRTCFLSRSSVTSSSLLRWNKIIPGAREMKGAYYNITEDFSLINLRHGAALQVTDGWRRKSRVLVLNLLKIQVSFMIINRRKTYNFLSIYSKSNAVSAHTNKKKPQTFFRHGCWAVRKEISPCKRIPYIIGMDELLLQPDSCARVCKNSIWVHINFF